jgi:hypothetical protein
LELRLHDTRLEEEVDGVRDRTPLGHDGSHVAADTRARLGARSSSRAEIWARGLERAFVQT